jgi:hypothetical protein
LFIHEHIFTFRPLCLHSITKILRNGPRAHFPFKLAPAKKIRKRTKSRGCQTDRKEEAPPTLPPSRIENLSDVEEMSLASLDDLLREFGDTLEREFGSTLENARS